MADASCAAPLKHAGAAIAWKMGAIDDLCGAENGRRSYDESIERNGGGRAGPDNGEQRSLGTSGGGCVRHLAQPRRQIEYPALQMRRGPVRQDYQARR